MSKNKTRPTVAAAGRENAANISSQNKHPQSYCTTAPEQRQGLIESLLQHGAENAIPAQKLVEMLGISDTRTLRTIISRERENGGLILSGSRGYYLPAEGSTGKAEIMRFEHTMHARAIHNLTVTKAAREALKRLDGQISFDDMGAII